jgi:hypothetical protein
VEGSQGGPRGRVFRDNHRLIAAARLPREGNVLTLMYADGGSTSGARLRTGRSCRCCRRAGVDPGRDIVRLVSAIGGSDQPAPPPRNALALVDLEVTLLAHLPPRPTTAQASSRRPRPTGWSAPAVKPVEVIDDHDVAARPPGSTPRTIAQPAAPLDQDPVGPRPVTRLLRSRKCRSGALGPRLRPWFWRDVLARCLVRRPQSRASPRRGGVGRSDATSAAASPASLDNRRARVSADMRSGEPAGRGARPAGNRRPEHPVGALARVSTADDTWRATRHRRVR